jgi:membrane protease YdiL (CAAX protease family)
MGEEDKGIPINRKLLLGNMALSQALLLLVSFLLVKFVTREENLSSLFRLPVTGLRITVGTFLGGALLLLAVQFFFYKFVAEDQLTDAINIYLIENFSLPELFLIFLSGAGTEEILFRGVIQPYWGVWLTSLLFALIHFRYIRKFYLLLEVFLMGMILGYAYVIVQSVWIPACCHWAVNYVTAMLIKKGVLKY